MSFAVPVWFAAVGRAYFASAVIFFGAEHLFAGACVTRILTAWPEWVPGRQIWPSVTGVGLIAAGVALFLPESARRAGLILGAVTLGSAFLLAVPAALQSGNVGAEWTNAGKALMLGGGALLVAASFAPPIAAPQAAALTAVGRVTLSGFLILCGVQHFLWAQFVATLVPGWIPAPMAWTYFAGVALIAGGVGLLIHALARLAAVLTAVMVFLWVILLHVPRALTMRDFNESTAVFEALAVTGIALLLAAAPQRADRPVSSPAAARVASVSGRTVTPDRAGG